MSSKMFSNQRGLSIIELMIALLISSILILGITQVYLDSKRNHMFHQGQTANLDTSRFSALMFEEILSKAGYRRNPERLMSEAFPDSTDLNAHCSPFKKGHTITKLKSSDEVGLCIRYQPAVRGEPICDGTTTTLASESPFLSPQGGEMVVVALKFEPGQEQSDGVIRCISNKGGNAELIDGIADVRIMFGAGEEKYRRIKGTGFKNAADWSSSDGVVRAIRFELLSAGGRGSRDGDSAVFDRWLDGSSQAVKTRLNAQDQRHIYQLVVGSQAIRNLMP